MKTKNMTALHLRNSISRSPLRRGFLLVALAWFALSPMAQAVSPPPDGGYPNDNTAEGDNALFSLTSGAGNTATGFQALYSNTTVAPPAGADNTATGSQALFSNTTGFSNTATGVGALYSNTTGFYNTATGLGALYSNTTGWPNTATGFGALQSNTIGSNNTATGYYALVSNTTGFQNTATGQEALLGNTTGSHNIALGFDAGINLTTGSNNIEIGNAGGLTGTGDKNTIRIGTIGTQQATFIAGIYNATSFSGTAVYVNSQGQLGTMTSSRRFKEQIKPMDKASKAILSLRPVTFRYKQELDPKGIPQFGLVAEEVEKVSPDLVARDGEGKVYTVRYEAVNAMLLNEFLKEHRTVQELKSIVAKQEATAAQQQKEIKALTASLKEQASQIQKVSAQLELSIAAPQMVINDQ
jgi:trimeric autotransporter adhesin